MTDDRKEVGAWIDWAGGECPVEPGTRVHIKARDGFNVVKLISGDEPEVEWEHRPDNHPEWDIVAYRVVS